MLQKLAKIQIRAPRTFFGFYLIILFLLIILASQLQIDPSFTSLVGKESEYNTNDRILTNAFGTNEAVLIIVREDSQTILTNARRIQDLEEYFTVLEETLYESQYLEELQGPIISDDGRYAQYVAVLYAPETPDSFKLVLEELSSLVQDSGPPPGIEVQVTGLPILLDRVTTLLINDNLITVFLTLAFIFLILLFYARDWVFALITLAIPLTSLIGLAAVMVLFSIEVTITLAAVGVLVLGLGADYSIHMATHYRDARRHHENHENAILHTVEELKVPITASFLTTLGGFAALIFGVSPSSQAQGIVLALAITIIYFCTFLIFPTLLTLFGQSPGKPNPLMAKVRATLSKIAIFQARRKKLVLVIATIITIIMVIGASKVQFSTSNSNWIPDDDPVSQSFRELNYVYGDSDSLTLILVSTKGDLRNSQTARDVDRIVKYLETMPNVDSVSSPFDVGYDSVTIYDHITNNPNFNHDYTVTRVVISTQNPDQDDAGKSLLLLNTREVVERYPVHNAEILLFGDSVRFDELGDSLQRDAGVTTMLGLMFVFFIASAIYASVKVGLLAMIPIVVAVIWTVGLMGWFSVWLPESLSTGIVSLVLGVGVDFSIHLVDGIRRNMKKGIEKAISLTMKSTGSAILLSSITTFVGFMALTFARLLGTQRLGYSLALSILSVFVVTMMLVPAVMAFGRRKKK